MANKSLNRALRHLCRLATVQSARELADHELLKRFIGEKDEAAFAVLVERHGRMILGVCRRALGSAHDAEDACQTTFLVLAQKASSIRKTTSLPSWLHGVASRVAANLKRERMRRCRRERESHRPPIPDPATEVSWREVQTVLDEELERLPERWRAPLILCHLQGRTRDEAAQQLGLSVPCLHGQLVRGRTALCKALTRRGIALSGALLATAVAEGVSRAALSPALVLDTAKAAVLLSGGRALNTGLVSTEILSLAQGVIRNMFLTKLKVGAAALLCAGLLLTALGSSLTSVGAEEQKKAPAQPFPGAARQASEEHAAAVPPVSPPADKDRAAMVGTWESTETVTRRIGDKVFPPEERKVRWVVTDDKFIRTSSDGFIEQEWRYQLDPTMGPKAIDLVNPIDGTFQGVYVLDGDTLKVQLGREPGKRPAELPAKFASLWHFKRVSTTPAKVTWRFPNDPGCLWVAEPSAGWLSMSLRGMVCVYETDSDGAAVITLAGALPRAQPPEYRPVLLDAGNERHIPERMRFGGGSGRGDGVAVALSRWRMDPKVLPARKVARIGIETLTPEFHRAASRAAAERAARAGVEVLPWPEVGQPYSFALTTVDGKSLRSKDLTGKVVLLDCWSCT
jgi:RNA polymerase sigma factor (sigma-70 family)